jgi:hypothetical protein
MLRIYPIFIRRDTARLPLGDEQELSIVTRPDLVMLLRDTALFTIPYG